MEEEAGRPRAEERLPADRASRLAAIPTASSLCSAVPIDKPTADVISLLVAGSADPVVAAVNESSDAKQGRHPLLEHLMRHAERATTQAQLLQEEDRSSEDDVACDVELQLLRDRAAEAEAAAKKAKELADAAFVSFQLALRDRDNLEADLLKGGEEADPVHSPPREKDIPRAGAMPRSVAPAGETISSGAQGSQEVEINESIQGETSYDALRSDRADHSAAADSPVVLLESHKNFGLSLGCGVRIEGLKRRSELNGRLGQIINFSQGKYGVRVFGCYDLIGNPLGVRVHPANMVPAKLPDDAPQIPTQSKAHSESTGAANAASPCYRAPSGDVLLANAPNGTIDSSVLDEARLIEARSRSAAEGAKAAELIAEKYARAVPEVIKQRNLEIAAIEPELLDVSRPPLSQTTKRGNGATGQAMRCHSPQESSKDSSAARPDKAANSAAPTIAGLIECEGEPGNVDSEMSHMLAGVANGFVPVRSPEGFVVGDRVFVHGVDDFPELNGAAGTITGLNGGRFAVRMMGRRDRYGACLIVTLDSKNIKGRSQDGLSLDAFSRPSADRIEVPPVATSESSLSLSSEAEDSGQNWAHVSPEANRGEVIKRGGDKDVCGRSGRLRDEEKASSLEKSNFPFVDGSEPAVRGASASERARNAMAIIQTYARNVLSAHDVELAEREAKAAAIIANNVARAERLLGERDEEGKTSDCDETQGCGKEANGSGNDEQPWWGDAIHRDDEYVLEESPQKGNIDRWSGWEFDEYGRAYRRPGRDEPLTQLTLPT